MISSKLPRLALILLLGGSGVLHLVKPAPYVKIVPRGLPEPDLIVLVSGVAELILAAMLSVQRTRRTAGWMTGLFLLAVFPGNVQMFLDAQPSTPRWWLTLVRLPLQGLFIYWAIRIWRDPEGSGSYPSGSGASSSPAGLAALPRE